MNINNNREKYWNDQITLWEGSGLTQTEYCRQNKINRQLFSKWKNSFSKNTRNKFVSIPVKIKENYSFSPEIELIIKEKYKIKIHPDFNPESLKKIIKALEG